MLNKILILLILFVMGSCSKNELIPNKVTSKINLSKSDTILKVKSKKKKFRLFKKRKLANLDRLR
jgi:hypothetical protein